MAEKFVPYTVLLDHGHNLRLSALASYWEQDITATMMRLIDEVYWRERPKMNEWIKSWKESA